MSDAVFQARALKSDLIKIFAALGVDDYDAGLVADVLIRADQWGVKSHGVFRVKRYVDCLTSGGIKPDAKFSVLKKAGAWALCSAQGGLGIPASYRAMKLAMELAREHAIGAVNVCHSHHNGAEGYYSNMCAEAGMAGVTMSTGNPIMAVTGGSARAIGNNPFAYAVPAGKYGTVMMDIAMSAVADGKVQVAKAAGLDMPEGCFLDGDGRPSTHPDDYLSGGVLLPFGGHKGYGLAVMVECFAGILSGAALTQDINSWNETAGKDGNTGHMFIAVDISQTQPLERFTSQVEKMVSEFKSGKKLLGVSEILVPGELERERLKKAGNSVSVALTTVALLREAASMAGVKCQNF